MPIHVRGHQVETLCHGAFASVLSMLKGRQDRQQAASAQAPNVGVLRLIAILKLIKVPYNELGTSRMPIHLPRHQVNSSCHGAFASCTSHAITVP
jgi:hypothetical protein